MNRTSEVEKSDINELEEINILPEENTVDGVASFHEDTAGDGTISSNVSIFTK